MNHMGLVKVTTWGYRCQRCEHEWVPRGLKPSADGGKPEESAETPRVCPKCKSPYWDKPRQVPAKDKKKTG
jgi:DNA-directed RNA polymerase subunit RPC12/RpoP